MTRRWRDGEFQFTAPARPRMTCTPSCRLAISISLLSCPSLAQAAPLHQRRGPHRQVRSHSSTGVRAKCEIVSKLAAKLPEAATSHALFAENHEECAIHCFDAATRCPSRRPRGRPSGPRAAHRLRARAARARQGARASWDSHPFGAPRHKRKRSPGGGWNGEGGSDSESQSL